MIQQLRFKGKFLIIYFFLFITNFINAQEEKSNRIKNFNNYSYITTNLLSHLNHYSPRIRVGYIQNINNRWKVGLDLGYGNDELSIFDNSENYGLWEIRPELYYFTRAHKTYLSAEFFYINHKDIFVDDLYYPIDEESTKYDRVNYQRKKYGVNIKYGFLFNSRGKITFNLYTGLGLRIRDNNFTNIVNPRIVDVGPEGGDMFGFEVYRRMERTNLTPNFVLGFKILFRLNN